MDVSMRKIIMFSNMLSTFVLIGVPVRPWMAWVVHSTSVEVYMHAEPCLFQVASDEGIALKFSI